MGQVLEIDSAALNQPLSAAEEAASAEHLVCGYTVQQDGCIALTVCCGGEPATFVWTKVQAECIAAALMCGLPAMR
jgi:hypothetical protein